VSRLLVCLYVRFKLLKYQNSDFGELVEFLSNFTRLTTIFIIKYLFFILCFIRPIFYYIGYIFIFLRYISIFYVLYLAFYKIKMFICLLNNLQFNGYIWTLLGCCIHYSYNYRLHIYSIYDNQRQYSTLV